MNTNSLFVRIKDVKKTTIVKMNAIRFLTIFVISDLKSSARKMTLRFLI